MEFKPTVTISIEEYDELRGRNKIAEIQAMFRDAIVKNIKQVPMCGWKTEVVISKSKLIKLFNEAYGYSTDVIWEE